MGLNETFKFLIRAARDAKRHPATRIRTFAAALLLMAMLPLAACSPKTSMSTYYDGSESVRPQPPDGRFDQEAARRLTPERRRQLDIEFFNQFRYKSEGPDTSDREGRIRAAAEEGLEVAYLAEQLYNFKNGGLPWFRPGYQPYWERLRALAASGDASAQCLLWEVAREYRYFKLDPPTAYDVDVLAPRYLKAAAEQGHPYCTPRQVGKEKPDYFNNNVETELVCARLGVHECQEGMAARYASGRSVPVDKVKALCWIYKAKSNNSAPSLENFFRSQSYAVWKVAGQAGEDKLFKVLTPETDCDQVSEALLKPTE